MNHIEPDQTTKRDGQKWPDHLTPEEAELAFEDAQFITLSEERIKEIVRFATDKSTFEDGYKRAMRLFETKESETEYRNMYQEGSEAHRGFEEAVYDLTQK